jgi:hypothetical protein
MVAHNLATDTGNVNVPSYSITFRELGTPSQYARAADLSVGLG